MDKKIIFNDFIDIFYSNINKNKMSLHIDFNNASDEIDNSKINIYDIHCVLLELLIAGVNNFSLNLMNDIELNEAIEKLQYFFDNINIIINIINFSKKDIIDDDSVYESRYMKILSDNPDKFILNGQHIIVENLKDIKTFYLINDEINICISFILMIL